jgi:hypothetical protein
MQFHTQGKRLPKGLDDGTDQPSTKTKKRKLDASATTAVPEKPSPQDSEPIPKIQPGERLSDFAARVDHALPIAGLGGTDKQRAARVPGLKEEGRTTKHNKRLARMQAEWREAERRRKEKMEEEVEEEEEREEHGLLWNGVGGKRKKKRGKGKAGGGPEGGEDEDPWKALDKSRADARQRNLQDVVQAPPQLMRVKSRLKEVGGGGGVGVDVGNVPSSVGSLRKREEMGQARRKVIDGYRKRMGRG